MGRYASDYHNRIAEYFSSSPRSSNKIETEEQVSVLTVSSVEHGGAGVRVKICRYSCLQLG
jgi:hypothetical protein